MKVFSYRIVYRYADDETEYAATVDAHSEAEARAALMSIEPIIIVRVEVL